MPTRAQRRKEEARRIGDRVRQKRLMAEVRQGAAEFAKGLDRYLDPAEAVQRILDNMMTLYEYAVQQVMELSEDEYWRETLAGKTHNEWIKEQERLGLQIVHVAGKAAAMGLAERTVRLQEQQAAIFASVVEAALVQAGIGADQRREVHQTIAVRLDDITSTARELEA